MTERYDLKRFALLGELSEEERDVVADELEAMSIAEGEVLFEEGEESHGLVLVVEGRFRLESRRTGSLGAAHPGQVLGAASLVAIGTREATAVAETASRVLLLRRSSFRRLVEDAPRAACRLAEAVATDLAALVRAGLDTIAPRAVDRSEGEA